MGKKLFLVLVMLLCMAAPSRAHLFDHIDDVKIEVEKLTAKVDELVELEKEHIELLKKIQKELIYMHW